MLQDGWSPLEEVQRVLRRVSAGHSDVEQVVTNSFRRDGTPRFEMQRKGSRMWIRATAEHTIAGLNPGQSMGEFR